MRDTQREAETQAEREAGSTQGVRCGTPTQDPRITPWAEGRRSTTEPPMCPSSIFILNTMNVLDTLYIYLLAKYNIVAQLCQGLLGVGWGVERELRDLPTNI